MFRSFIALALTLPIAIRAASPWPAESSSAALKLTSLDPEFTSDMSGAYWNGTTRTFWVSCNNPGTFWALQQNAVGNWQIATNAAGTQARWPAGGDLEGICQANDSDPSVFVMDEDGWIRQYSVTNYGVVSLMRSWDIRTYCPEDGGDGPEAITFVPDDWLRHEGFRDGSGTLRTSSNGMGGLMFVGSQIGGFVHVFDLNTNASTYTYCGSNQTSRTETADLAFDRATGKLYIWHNTGANYLEVAELNSTLNGNVRRFRTLMEYTGPRSGNLEGFALVSTSETNDWCLITDDNNADDEGVTLYQQFRPLEDTDNDGLSDDWELRYFGSTAISNGQNDSDGDGASNLHEFRAGTNPTNALSLLSIQSLTFNGTNTLITWQTAGGRTNIVQAALNPAQSFTDLSPPIVIPGSGDVLTNYLDSANTNSTGRFYRIRTSP
ncbi:MAG TPA: hypothetical protein VFZ59_18890 [Verrucomicrobiae bacterium]|nr:hypothetical protein [Verrucomicrobiae bacterium]